jgi:hypothetical protein
MDSASPMYVDEEDCLGFKIWVAELELLVGSSRGRRKANPGHVHRLLQKLVATLDRAGREEIREYQRKAEDALIDILLKGAPPPVRCSISWWQQLQRPQLCSECQLVRVFRSLAHRLSPSIACSMHATIYPSP